MRTRSNSIEGLINQLNKLPGIGNKTSQRLAYYILDMDMESVKKLSESIMDAKLNTKECKICGNFSDSDICEICSDESRDRHTICVVEFPKDLEAMEGANCYHGLYHVLHGVISPQRNVSENDIRIRELVARLETEEIEEIIIATNPTVNGDVTAQYIARLLDPLEVKVSRIGYGLPVGGDLEYYDEVTISTAMENRRIL